MVKSAGFRPPIEELHQVAEPDACVSVVVCLLPKERPHLIPRGTHWALAIRRIASAVDAVRIRPVHASHTKLLRGWNRLHGTPVQQAWQVRSGIVLYMGRPLMP